MESLLSFFRTYWDHEPTASPSQEGSVSVGQFPSWEGSGVRWSAPGSWKPTTFAPCIGTMNLKRVGQCPSAELLSGFFAGETPALPGQVHGKERVRFRPTHRLASQACSTGLTRLSWPTLTYAQRRSAIRSGDTNIIETNPGRCWRCALRFAAFAGARCSIHSRSRIAPPHRLRRLW
jgi:hypothetical protein